LNWSKSSDFIPGAVPFRKFPGRNGVFDAFAPVLLTSVVKPALIANGGSVLHVSSMDHNSSVFDPGNMQGERSWSGYEAYARSKLFNIMFTLDLSSGDNAVRSNSLDPGVITTKLLHAGWSLAGDEVSVGGDDVFETVIEIARHGYNGEYFENARPAICSSVARAPAARQENEIPKQKPRFFGSFVIENVA